MRIKIEYVHVHGGSSTHGHILNTHWLSSHLPALRTVSTERLSLVRRRVMQYNSIYLTFKNRQYYSMVIGIRRVSLVVSRDWGETGGGFLGLKEMVHILMWMVATELHTLDNRVYSV